MFNIFIIYIAIIISTALLNNIRLKKIVSSEEFKQYLNKVQLFHESIEDNKMQYFTNSMKINLLDSYSEVYKTLNKNIYKKIKNSFLQNRNLVFLNIVKPIYMQYQDISKIRFNLIKEIKNQSHAKLMCVGDDWQSIYRFAGSDIDLFTNFEKYVGYYELLKIEKTYRNSQELIDIAGKFVMKNEKQLSKNLKSYLFCCELIKEFNIIQTDQFTDKIKNKKVSCPKCKGGSLVERKNSNNGNSFIGCTNYPHCKNTKQYEKIAN